MATARTVRVRGVVQGVGFRPFVFRLATAGGVTGWVRNAGEGVEMHIEGAEASLNTFLHGLRTGHPPAARIAEFEIAPAAPAGFVDFEIRESRRGGAPTARISPDLAACDDCLEELFTPGERRCGYPYINCTNCGPRYTVILGLPYDRASTTMRGWPMDAYCAAQYGEPADRRFHAQPVACPECGPHYRLISGGAAVDGDIEAVGAAAGLLRDGAIVAVKGLGGYHLACDARRTAAVMALRDRKFRKEKPFAVMTRGIDGARRLVRLSLQGEAALASSARPIVLAPGLAKLDGVAPESDELGVMLAYTPLHHLLFAAGAPEPLVMTSANRSNEPIAYEDEDAFERLAGIADAFLVGERPIARRVDDSVVRVGPFGPAVLRRARGFAPAAVARLPVKGPILALGADLKNSITLVVDGQAFMSQHIGDLEHFEAFQAFTDTIRDLTAMYGVTGERLLVAHDAHPQYRSSLHAQELAAEERRAVQHHRAHIASAVAEREAWDEPVIGVSFDGTGYGDDGSIWGGEVFAGSVAGGLERVGHLRSASLPGGDAAARFPVQAAAGFLSEMEGLPDFTAAPFEFPARYGQAVQLVRSGQRTFATTSAGRLFDTAAAVAGFTRPITFEGQAAMWLEHLAGQCRGDVQPYPVPFDGGELDWRPMLRALIADRLRGEDPAVIARRFHSGLAQGICAAAVASAHARGVGTVALSGGVFQNALLLGEVAGLLADAGMRVWTNSSVPANDGGISLGQAALAAVGARALNGRGSD